MKTIEIKGSIRKELGKKSSKQIRKAEGVPCVIYGKESNIHFQAQELSFKNLVYTHEAHLVDLNLDGKVYKTVLQDIQFHPVSDKLLHADFLELIPGKAITVSLPIRIEGVSKGVLRGGKMVKKFRKLKVKGLAEHIPNEIILNISDLDINDTIKVGDIKIENLHFMDLASNVVVSIASTRAVVAEENKG